MQYLSNILKEIYVDSNFPSLNGYIIAQVFCFICMCSFGSLLSLKCDCIGFSPHSFNNGALAKTDINKCPHDICFLRLTLLGKNTYGHLRPSHNAEILCTVVLSHPQFVELSFGMLRCPQ